MSCKTTRKYFSVHLHFNYKNSKLNVIFFWTLFKICGVYKSLSNLIRETYALRLWNVCKFNFRQKFIYLSKNTFQLSLSLRTSQVTNEKKKTTTTA